jgi:hypothetical protein
MAGCAVAQFPNRFLPPDIVGKDSMQATSGAFDVLYVGGSSVQDFSAAISLRAKQIQQSGSTFLDIKQTDTLNGIRLFIGAQQHVYVADDNIRLRKGATGGRIEILAGPGDIELQPATGTATRLKEDGGNDALVVQTSGVIDLPFGVTTGGSLGIEDLGRIYPLTGTNDIFIDGPVSIRDSSLTTQIRVGSIPSMPNGFTAGGTGGDDIEVSEFGDLDVDGDTVLSGFSENYGGFYFNDEAWFDGAVIFYPSSSVEFRGLTTHTANAYFNNGVRSSPSSALWLRAGTGQVGRWEFPGGTTAIRVGSTVGEVQFARGLLGTSNFAAGTIGVRASGGDASKAMVVTAGAPSAGQVDNLFEVQVSGKTLPAPFNGRMLEVFRSGNSPGVHGFTKAMARVWDNDSFSNVNTGPLFDLRWTNAHTSGSRAMQTYTIPSAQSGSWGYFWKVGTDFGNTLTFEADMDGNIITDGYIESYELAAPAGSDLDLSAGTGGGNRINFNIPGTGDVFQVRGDYSIFYNYLWVIDGLRTSGSASTSSPGLGDFIVQVDASGSPQTLTFAASQGGWWRVYVKTDPGGNAITLQGATGLINGQSTYTGLTRQYQCIDVWCDGTNFWTLSTFEPPDTVQTISATGPVSRNAGLVKIDASGGAVVLTLPVVSHTWRFKVITNPAAGPTPITLQGASGTIDGAANYTGLGTQWQAIDVVCDGTNFFLF